MARGSLQVPLTAGAVGVVGSWEAGAVERPTLADVGASTSCCDKHAVLHESGSDSPGESAVLWNTRLTYRWSIWL